MNLQNQPPVFVPLEYQKEFEQLSKAALMDLVWDLLAGQVGEMEYDEIMAHFRARAGIVLHYRKQSDVRGIHSKARSGPDAKSSKVAR